MSKLYKLPNGIWIDSDLVIETWGRRGGSLPIVGTFPPAVYVVLRNKEKPIEILLGTENPDQVADNIAHDINAIRNAQGK